MFICEDWKDGVSRYTIAVGEYSASVLSLGATLQSFKLRDRDVVLGFDDLEGYASQNAYMGQVVGPVANRIAGACFELDGRKYVLDRNDGKNSLHSGTKNFGAENWMLAGHSDASVTLSLISGPKGGFDQTHEVMATYFLSEDGELTIDYQVTSDRKCPVNVTNHAYFNLGGGDVRNTVLRFSASNYVATDGELIPTGLCGTAGTDFDFSSPHRIGERRNGAYDTCFVLDEDSVLTAEKDGLVLSMRTTLPAFQLYTGEFLSSDLAGKDGRPYGAFDGFAIETSYYPDFVNHPSFEGAYTIAGAIWRATTTYRLEEKR